MSANARRDASRLARLLRTEHHAMADFLLALADFDRRRTWARLGHASLWSFLHRDLGLSAGAAYHRKVAAGLLLGFPGVEAPLRDGRLCLSSVCELARVLTPENQAEILPRFFRLSAREAKDVAAALVPRRMVPTREVVTVPACARGAVDAFQTSEVGSASRAGNATSGAAPGDDPPAGLQGSEAPGSSRARAEAAPADPTGPSTSDGPSASTSIRTLADAGMTTPTTPPAAPPLRGPDVVEPLTADLRRLHVTVSRRFLQKLEAARRARAHARPGATTETVLEEALDLLLAREAKRQTASTSRPLSEPRSSVEDRIPAHVRREVWARDGGCCQWPLDSGGVCGSTFQLELDHVLPRARGGSSAATNLRVLCRPHNAEAARQAYGAAWMRRAVEWRTRRAEPGRDPGGPSP